MPFADNAAHDLWSVFSEIACTEEGCPHVVRPQDVKDTLRTLYRNLHTLAERVIIHAVFTRHIKLLYVKTKQNHEPLNRQ